MIARRLSRHSAFALNTYYAIKINGASEEVKKKYCYVVLVADGKKIKNNK